MAGRGNVHEEEGENASFTCSRSYGSFGSRRYQRIPEFTRLTNRHRRVRQRQPSRASDAWRNLGAYSANEQLLRDYEGKVDQYYTPEMLAAASSAVPQDA